MSLTPGATMWLCAAASIGKHKLPPSGGLVIPWNNLTLVSSRILVMAKVELGLGLACRGYAESQGAVRNCPMYAQSLEAGIALIPDDWIYNKAGYSKHWAARLDIPFPTADMQPRYDAVRHKLHVASLTYHKQYQGPGVHGIGNPSIERYTQPRA